MRVASSGSPVPEAHLPSQPNLFPGHRAEPPRSPVPSASARKVQYQQAAYLHERESKERRSVLRGLTLLALVVLLISLLRAGMGRAFFTGWWHQW